MDLEVVMKMPMRVLLGASLLLGATLLACGQSAAPAIDSQTYTFGGPKNINMLPILAENQDFFRDHGLTMKREDILTGGLTYDAFVDGDVDIGIIVDTNISFDHIQANPAVEIIAVIQEKFDDAIIADNSIQKPKDFEGKTIAITPLTTSHAFAVFYLIENGVDLVV